MKLPFSNSIAAWPGIKTRRLTITPEVADQLSELKSIWLEPQIQVNFPQLWQGESGLEVALAEIRDNSYSADLGLLAIRDQACGELYGHCGIMSLDLNQKVVPEWFCVLSPAHWGKGIGTEAAKALLDYAFASKIFEEVVDLVNEDDHGACKMAEKSGFIPCERVEICDTWKIVYRAKPGMTESAHLKP